MKLQTLIEGLQFVRQNYGDDVRIIVRMNDKAEGLSDSEGFHSDIVKDMQVCADGSIVFSGTDASLPIL